MGRHRVGVVRAEAAEDVTARTSTRYRWVVAAASGVAFVVLASLAVNKHNHFGTQAFDLGIFDQGLWLLSRFKEPFVTLRGLNLFGDHSSYVMIPLAPLYWIWADVRLLIIVTVAATSVGGVLLYEVARAERVRPPIAAALGIAYLLHPAVAWIAWDSFHPEILAIPLLLGAHLLFLRGRAGWGMLLIVLVLAAKEDAALVVVPYGLYLWWRLRNPRPGLLVAIVGVVVFILNITILLPAFSPSGELIYTGRYAQFGDSLSSSLWGMATSPGAVLDELLTLPRVMYVVVMLVPMALALLAPEVLLIAVPITLANLLSLHTYQHDIRFHYTAYLIAVVMLAAAVGTRRLQGWLSSRNMAIAAVGVIAVGAIALITVGPVAGRPSIPGLDDRHPQLRNPWGLTTLTPAAIEDALAQIPGDAVVSADYTIAPHLAHRTGIYMFPNPFLRRFWSIRGDIPPSADDVEWVVVRKRVVSQFDDVSDGLELVERGPFERVIENDEVIVLRRVSTS